MSRWSLRSNTIGNTNHQRYHGTVGSAANTSRRAVLCQRLSPYASPLAKDHEASNSFEEVLSGGLLLHRLYQLFLLCLFGRRFGDEAI
jgi:hypothetical protein